MNHARFGKIVIHAGLLCFFCILGNAQTTAPQPSPERHVLYLNGGNNGQQVTAQVGQAIQLTLQTIGPGQYGSPEISSAAIRFEGATFPKEQNPGGPKQVYHFRARSEGEARIKIPHVLQLASGNTSEIRDPNSGFVFTIRVYQRQ